ncbi:FUN14 domain-containing protein 2-like [Uloborus diversus]|uniref:FUN14 domain-containing protein 2-like n=1 Tax=Uloborus diversus TaxID=327109 RepID=UPI00240A5229|nr:FUN14 domain-containing protein 2-like [Uloborus diversus]
MPAVSESFNVMHFKKKKEEKWIDKTLKEVTDGSVSKQMFVGAVSGWCAGVVCSKVGKTAASALAGGLFMFQVAQHQGYIKVNWNKVNKDLEKAKKKLDKHSTKELPWFLEEAKSFLHEYKFLVTGFGGGFLLGIAMF